MKVNVEIGPYILQKRTSFSKFHLLDAYTKEDITKENKDIFDKIVKDYTAQTSNPDKYFRMNDKSILKLEDAVSEEKIKFLFMPEGIELIEWSAAENGRFEYVKLPDSLIRINAYAFENCENLKELFIPDSVEDIEHGAFNNCVNLEKINLPNIDKIHSKLFCYCKKLKEIIIPDSVKTIETYAFADCFSLEKIYLPSSLKEIGFGTFDGCKSLKNINLPKSLESIHASAFANCGLEEITLPNKINDIYGELFINCKNLKKVNLPKNIASIMGGAFSNCTSLEEITLPNSVKRMGGSVFKNTPKIKNINIPKNLEDVSGAVFLDSEVKSLTFNYDLKCFSALDTSLIESSKIDKLIISKNVEKIDVDAFILDCYQITAIDYLGTKEQFEEFKNNNKKLFNMFTNLKEINFKEDKEKEDIKIHDVER